MEEVVWTEGHLMALPDIGYKAEVIEGELQMAPAGVSHGNHNLALSTALRLFVQKHNLGVVVDSSTGFTVSPGNLLCPDVAFVSIRRLRELGSIPTGFYPNAPDLAVEVLSPGDKPRNVAAKISAYLANGTKLVWLVDPTTKSVTVHRPKSKPRKLTTTLSGGDVLPGFELNVKDIFWTPKL